MARSARLIVTLLVATLAGMPAAARAATPQTIGQGHKPGVAIDAAGTAYIAWYGPESGTNTLRFCRLPRGAGGCDAGVAPVITAPGTTLSRPFVTVSGNTVRVVSYRYGLSGPGFPNFDEVWEFTSVNRGASFDGGHPIGRPPFDEAVQGPGDTISVATNAFQNGLVFQNMPLGGGTSGNTEAVLSQDHPYNGTVGLIDAGTPLVAFSNGSSFTQFRRYVGSGSLNDAANWTLAVDIGYADYPRLAGGPLGLFLLAGTESGGLVVRRYTGTTFDGGAALGSGDDAQDHLTQDAAGRLQAVFPRLDALGYHLIHAVSDDGANWRSGNLDVQASDTYASLRIAAAPDHIGLAAWESSSAQVRVIGTGPDAPIGKGPPPVIDGFPPLTVNPTFHETVVVKPVKGTILVRPKGAKRFTKLTGTRVLALEFSVDARRGTLELSSQPKPGAASQSARFRAGMFKVSQPGSVTSLALNGPLRSCGAKAQSATAAAAKKPRTRSLFGDGKGAFRTRGRYSAATVRGTSWLVRDSCAGTLTRVLRGVVSVRDNVKRKTIIVRAGKHYLARPKRH